MSKCSHFHFHCRVCDGIGSSPQSVEQVMKVDARISSDLVVDAIYPCETPLARKRRRAA
jgi:hypothetical protein